MEKKHKNCIMLIVIALFIFGGIVYPIFWVAQKQESQMMGDMEVFGFDAYGWVNVENAVGKMFRFYEGNFNVTTDSKDCQIISLKVLKGKEKGSAFYDTVLFNATGKVIIRAVNISFFSCEVLTENSTGTVYFTNNETKIFLPSYSYPTNDILFWFESNISNMISISLLEGVHELLIDFGAYKGEIQVIGNQNFTLPLEEDRAGILLVVSIPRNRNYNIEVTGTLKQLYIQNWKIIKVVFLEGPSFNSLKLLYPKGEFTVEGKSYRAAGSQHLNFTDFSGVVHVLPTSNLNLFRILIGGTIESILLESSGKTSNMTEKSVLDILPIPSLFILLFIGVIIWYRNRGNILFYLLLIISFSLCCFFWAVKTEQASIIQNFLGYVSFSLIVALITNYTLRKRKEGEI